MTSELLRSRPVILAIFICLYLILSVQVMGEFLMLSHFGDAQSEAPLSSMLEGNAPRPFVGRMLLPQLIRIIIFITPSSVETTFNQVLKHTHLLHFFRTLDPGASNILDTEKLLYARMLMVFIASGCLGGYLIFLYKLGRLFYPEEWAIALFAPVFGLRLISAFAQPVSYIYDFPDLILAAACYYYMVRKQWRYYLPLFFLECLNKESSIMILIMYGLWFFSRLDRTTYISYGLYQLSIYLTVKIGLHLLYSGNPEYLSDNYVIWLFIGHTYKQLVWFFMGFFLLTFRWLNKPLFLRYTLFLLPIGFVIFYLDEWSGESNILKETFPLLTLLITDTFIIGTDISKAPLFKMGPNKKMVKNHLAAENLPLA